MPLLCNDISHWLGASLDSALSRVQYIPRIMHIMQILLCFVLVSYHEILPIAFRVSFMGLGQSYESRDCVSASETTLKVMGNISHESNGNS